MVISSVKSSEITHCFDLFTLQHLWDFQERKDGVFETVEERVGPSDGPCHRRLILNEGWFVLPCLKDFICVVHLQKGQIGMSNVLSYFKSITY